jgi:hypothetical protein
MKISWSIWFRIIEPSTLWLYGREYIIFEIKYENNQIVRKHIDRTKRQNSKSDEIKGEEKEI